MAVGTGRVADLEGGATSVVHEGRAATQRSAVARAGRVGHASRMGLQVALGFRWTPPNPVQRSLQRAASTRAGGWVFQRTLYRVDRPLYRWSGGRLTLPGLATGLPVIMLSTTGAKSGLVRSMPVAAIPLGDDLAVVGTNFAQPRPPGWAFNLAKNPRAAVTWRGTTVSVTATPIPDADMPLVWESAGRVYAGFPKYRERLEGAREVMAFVLTPDA